MWKCPACDSGNLEPLARFGRSVTSDGLIVDDITDNVFCFGCGLVSNLAGPRGKELNFYRKYKLHSENTGAEAVSISNNQIVSANRQLVEYLYESKLLPKSGRLLDIGCGKGFFLREFRLKFPKWEVAGIELSDTAFVELKKEMPDVPLHHGGFENSPFRNEKFDLAGC